MRIYFIALTGIEQTNLAPKYEPIIEIIISAQR